MLRQHTIGGRRCSGGLQYKQIVKSEITYNNAHAFLDMELIPRSLCD